MDTGLLLGDAASRRCKKLAEGIPDPYGKLTAVFLRTPEVTQGGPRVI